MDFIEWSLDIENKAKDQIYKSGTFSFDRGSGKPFFGIDTPPPYPSGRPWHVGAAAQYAKIDIIARAARMRGFEVMFPIGLDRNGLPVEKYTEKKYNIKMRNTEREKFIELCRESLDELEKEMLEILKSIGLSADFNKLYRTDSEEYRAFTQSTFIKQWKEGRITVGKRPSNFCPDCGTTIADAEVEYKELPTNLVYFYFLLGKKKILIASTRPELLGSCQAVIVNPSDDRYKDLVGLDAEIPVYKRKVKIIAHPYAKPDFGSGAMMICSYGDYNDVMIIKELGLKENIIINTDDKINERGGPELEGLSVKKAREKMIDLLKRDGVLEKVEQISHRTPVCERSKTPIEIIPLDEYYFKAAESKDKLLEMAMNLKFIPEYHRQILIDWINILEDWPISRRRFYGTEIPVWYCKDCGEAYIPPPGKYYKPWKDNPPKGAKCIKCGRSDFIGDDRTFDTWMDSSVSALFVSGYWKDEHSKEYPLTIRPQGLDIIRTWLTYSLLRCSEISGKVPWEYVWIDGLGMDEHGEKMSKSKGNVVDPIPIIEKYGADAFRFWAASEANVGSNFIFAEKKLVAANKFINKLLNIARFVGSFQPVEAGAEDIKATDEWILSELSLVVDKAIEGYEKHNLFLPANKIRDFVWNVFAPHYIEMVKARAYGGDYSAEEKNSAVFTLRTVLRNVLLLLNPIMPFISSHLLEKIYGIRAESDALFEKINYNRFLELGRKITDFNSMVWAEKKRSGLSLRDEIKINIPQELEPFKADLIKMHGIIEDEGE